MGVSASGAKDVLKKVLKIVSKDNPPDLKSSYNTGPEVNPVEIQTKSAETSESNNTLDEE